MMENQQFAERTVKGKQKQKLISLIFFHTH